MNCDIKNIYFYCDYMLQISFNDICYKFSIINASLIIDLKKYVYKAIDIFINKIINTTRISN